MSYDNSISRGDAAARMPANVMGGKGKKTKKTSSKAVETNTFRSQAKKK